MKLLNDIVDLLMNEEGSLSEALLKTKVLLHEIGQKELVGWVNSELTGYKADEPLPTYRELTGRLYGNVSNGYWTHQNKVLPTHHLNQKQQAKFESAEMRHGLGVLEKLIVDTGSGNSLVRPIGPEYFQILSKPFTDGYYIQSAWSQIEVTQVRQIIVEARSRLLDFVLELRGEVGSTVSEGDIKAMTTNLDVPRMFDKAVFGDNTTIVVGNHNHSQITNTAVKHDKEALAAELRKHGVEEADIAALDVALTDDPAPNVPGQYGPAVQGWMKRMLGKAVDTTWNIKVGAAGSLLATVIQKYYGL